MAEIIEAKHASDAGHWYRQDGTPAYTIIGKNGAERNTTLRDARKLNLVPSVTGITSCASRPGLENWKADQILMSALTCKEYAGESNADWISRIKQDAAEQALKAREKGTLIHAWVQSYFEGESVPADAMPYCDAVHAELLKIHDGHWTCEESFAKDGYGGKCDIHTPAYVIDFKTTEKTLEGIKTWDEHAMQLSAYRQGLDVPNAQCGICYISTSEQTARLIWLEESELVKGLKMFNALKNFWYAKTGLVPA